MKTLLTSLMLTLIAQTALARETKLGLIQVGKKDGKLAIGSLEGIPSSETTVVPNRPSPLLNTARTPNLPASKRVSSARGATANTATQGASASNNSRLTVDDSTQRNGQGTTSVPPPNGSQGQGQSKTEEKDRFFNLCVFVDRALGDVNAPIKKLVDYAASAKACGVLIMVEPYYVDSNYAQMDAEALKEKMRTKCNPVAAFQRFGANRSAAVLITADESLPAKMCKAGGVKPEEKYACSEFGFQPQEGIEHTLRATGGWGGVAPPGTSAISIVNKHGLTDNRFSGAVLGKTLLTRPEGTKLGFGVGEWYEGQAGKTDAPSAGWTDEACKIMRENSFDAKKSAQPLPARWNPEQELYLSAKAAEGDKFLDITDGKPLYRDPTKAPPQGEGQGLAQGSGAPPISGSSGGSPGGSSSGGQFQARNSQISSSGIGGGGGGFAGHPGFGGGASSVSGAIVGKASNPEGVREVQNMYSGGASGEGGGTDVPVQSIAGGRGKSRERVEVNDAGATAPRSPTEEQNPLNGTFFSSLEVGGKTSSSGAFSVADLPSSSSSSSTASAVTAGGEPGLGTGGFSKIFGSRELASASADPNGKKGNLDSDFFGGDKKKTPPAANASANTGSRDGRRGDTLRTKTKQPIYQ